MRFVEFNNALGVLNFEDKHPMQQCTLAEFLTAQMDDGFDDEHEFVFVLKDVHRNLNEDSQVIALLQRIAERNTSWDDYRAKVVIIDSKISISQELDSLYHSC